MPSAFKKPNRAGRPDGVQKGDRVRAAFVRYFDASPQKLDELAAAAVEKAIAGDTGAFTFIRDTMDGRPIQRSDIHIAQQHRPSEELSDEELAARIAELEEECALH